MTDLPMLMNTNQEVTRITTDVQAMERIVMHAFRLPTAFRRVFLLCDIQGMTVDRAAGILGLSAAAVRTRLDRARREMNVRLAAGSPDHGFASGHLSETV